MPIHNIADPAPSVEGGHGAGRRVAFLFSGHGAQFFDMARGLYETEPLFASIMNKCAHAADPHLASSLLDQIYPVDEKQSHLHDIRYARPATFAVSAALGELWRSYGVEPDAVLGFSAGEYTAAAFSGAANVYDMAALLAQEAQLVARVTTGSMIAAQISEEEAKEFLPTRSRPVSIAAVNTAHNVAFSGVADGVNEVAMRLTSAGIRFAPLPVTAGLHSPLQEQLADELSAAAESVRFQSARIPMVSTVTGQRIDAELADPAYWPTIVRKTVRLHDGIRTLRKLGIDTFIEMGPGSALTGLGKQGLGDPTTKWIASLSRSVDGTERMQRNLAEFHGGATL